jgi:hypothetical protein
VCERHAAAAAAAPQNLDLRYLALRCPDDEPGLQQKFLDEHRQHPDHPFFANAAARELQRRRDYEGALAAYRVASGAPILLDAASLQAARLTRVIAAPDSALELAAINKQLRGGAMQGSHLQTMLTLESGEDEGEPITTPIRAYAHLGRGELSQAVQATVGEPKLRPQILRLVAASDGVEPELIEQALSLAIEEGVTGTTVLPSLALADREGKDHGALDAKAFELYGQERVPLEFASGKLYDGKAEEVQAQLFKLSAEMQVHACVMALVRAGEKAPGPCRPLVRGYLFAAERPFFR